MMINIKIIIAITSLVFGLNVLADFQDGLDAYIQKDYQIAYQQWLPLAQRGDVAAQTNLGAMYAKGREVLKDDKQALKWYKKAAEQGNADAQLYLGNMYAKGRRVLKDAGQAKYWLKKAYGNNDAQVATEAEKIWKNLELWKY